MTGWLKVHRKMKTSPIFSDPQLFKLWMLCLMKASHNEHDQLTGNQVVKLQPGQFVTGRIALTSEYNYGATNSNMAKETTVWRWLKVLEKMQMLDIKSTNKYSVITIVKWDDHQNNEQQMDNKRTTNEQQMDTTKNVKNDKNDKNKKPSSPKQVYDKESDEMKLVDFFESEIQRTDPKFKVPNKQTWSNDMRLLIKERQGDKSEIARIIRFVQMDDFEKSRVMSVSKLRKRYSELYAKAAQSQKPKATGHNQKNKVDFKALREKYKEDA